MRPFTQHSQGSQGSSTALQFTCILFPAYEFQYNLIKTMLQIEQTYMDLAREYNQNCLIICDRGVMDASACEYDL